MLKILLEERVTMKKFKAITSIFIAVSTMFIMSVSQAATLSFEKISANNNVDLTGQLSVDVTAIGDTAVELTFWNAVGEDSSVTDIYFDLGLADNAILDSSSVFSSISIVADSDGFGTAGYTRESSLLDLTNVDFNEGAKTAVLPGGNGQPISFTSNYDAGAKNVKKGLDNGGEFVTFLATLGSGSYESFIAGIADGRYRIGLKVQSIALACDYTDLDECPEDSSSYMTPPGVVPVPAAAWLFGTALFGFFATSRRKKNS